MFCVVWQKVAISTGIDANGNFDFCHVRPVWQTQAKESLLESRSDSSITPKHRSIVGFKRCEHRDTSLTVMLWVMSEWTFMSLQESFFDFNFSICNRNRTNVQHHKTNIILFLVTLLLSRPFGVWFYDLWDKRQFRVPFFNLIFSSRCHRWAFLY